MKTEQHDLFIFLFSIIKYKTIFLQYVIDYSNVNDRSKYFMR